MKEETFNKTHTKKLLIKIETKKIIIFKHKLDFFLIF